MKWFRLVDRSGCSLGPESTLGHRSCFKHLAETVQEPPKNLQHQCVGQGFIFFLEGLLASERPSETSTLCLHVLYVVIVWRPCRSIASSIKRALRARAQNLAKLVGRLTQSMLSPLSQHAAWSMCVIVYPWCDFLLRPVPYQALLAHAG